MTEKPRSEPRLADYPSQTFDKLRFADTDRLGHVNNAVFSTFLETGRTDLLYGGADPLAVPGKAFVIARLVLDFRAEAHWPGSVAIGTRVAGIGRSSFRLEQAVFQDERCIATAETVIVQIDEATRRSEALAPTTVQRLSLQMSASTREDHRSEA